MHFYKCVENPTAMSRVLGKSNGFSCERCCLSHAFFSRWRKVSNRNFRNSCPFLHGGLLGGDVENMNLPHDALQQTSRKGWAPGSVSPKHGQKGERAQENGDAFPFE